MKNTFLNRVSAERKVLKIVNTLFSGNLQLAGLSQAALLRWESAVGKNRVANVLPLLTDLAEQCQRLSDRSNETFMPIEEMQAIKIAEQLEVLALELTDSFVEHR
ncbi:hypothetical protein K3H30_14375 [Aeromonas veronii]|uniref:hypothetical protein n=1 Tax=Aeromonas veronii TaxID=654 RepID=UPI001F1809C8|nr:hypothetical protein [Aeromonas veronii]MCF5718886.1 hypothetical protein [Aeromonas veronii]